MEHTWILQANPKRYDIISSLQARPIIYWRVPQYTDELIPGDRALIWRAGRDAGFVGWGRFLATAAYYDLAKDNDTFAADGWVYDAEDRYAPVRVWSGDLVAKAIVAAVLPKHRIITAPMGTVFPLDAEDLAELEPLLQAHGYDLDRSPDDAFAPLALLPDSEPAAPLKQVVTASAKITPALFLLSSTPERPIEITLEGDALQLLIIERDALKKLDDDWSSVGVYLLIGKPLTEGAVLSVYVGKAQGLRARLQTGHGEKLFTRCLLIQRQGLHPFNASDISWLERRLIDVLLEAPSVDLTNKAPPPPEHVPEYKAEILERTVIAALGILGVLGAYTV